MTEPTAPSATLRPPTDATPGDALRDLARAGDWRTLTALGRFGLALQALRIGQEADADTVEALGALADVESAVRSKGLARARKRFDRIETRPAELIAWDDAAADLDVLAIAVPAVDRRELDEARAALAALRTDLFAAERDALLGTIAVLEGDTAAGLVAFEAALARDPSHVRAWTNRGNLRLEAGDVDGAIADYEQALRLDEGFANAHHNLGVAYRRKGQVAKSVASLRRAQKHASRRDAEEARATVAGAGRSAGGGRWRRWIVIALVAAGVLWWLQQRGTI